MVDSVTSDNNFSRSNHHSAAVVLSNSDRKLIGVTNGEKSTQDVTSSLGNISMAGMSENAMADVIDGQSDGSATEVVQLQKSNSK